MGSQNPPARRMPDAAYLVLRSEVLLAATKMSCDQALELADLLHTAIRMRKPGRPLKNVDHLFLDAANAWRASELRIVGDDKPAGEAGEGVEAN